MRPDVLKLTTRSSLDRADVIKALEDVLKHVRETDDSPGTWAVVIGLNCAGHANMTFIGQSHECLALSARLAHRVNAAIDEQNE